MTTEQQTTTDETTETPTEALAWDLYRNMGLIDTENDARVVARVILALQTLDSYENGSIISRSDHEAVKLAYQSNEAFRRLREEDGHA